MSWHDIEPEPLQWWEWLVLALFFGGAFIWVAAAVFGHHRTSHLGAWMLIASLVLMPVMVVREERRKARMRRMSR
jgi:drug/metabolite transporter (DMT)-like permease